MELRERIIQAAEQVIQTKGLARTTTKEIAREAKCSEGSLYNNFTSKEEIFLHILRGQLSNLMSVLTALPERKGTGTVMGNLEELAITALEDYYNSMPLMASIFSEPTLLTRHREGFIERNEGPHRANKAVESYLYEEQQLGRIDKGIDSRAAADMILGSCFQHAFQMRFLGREDLGQVKNKIVQDMLNTLFQGLETNK
ncbi:TetR/AcrR family transcriptional regulator [Evansella halocellulosilytica]|uniref:TetR/AcrR family transcriptional regulator n=1 Tax=Evansella halocellulosilytica TaxID=2011013 RepID=UPI000BB9A42D|nr:TetR/AcrR family transcriptional regulator [Evansella halocellulosilytica]